jgi:hypothetical protein
MSKVFDYKLIMMLGLSIVVYFLYREIEHLNKRLAEVEKSTQTIDLVPIKQEKTNDATEINTVEQVHNSLNEMNKHNTIEEYSNELYSHDKLDTNTNEHDPLMVDSIINMIKDDKKEQIENNENQAENQDDNHKNQEIQEDDHNNKVDIQDVPVTMTNEHLIVSDVNDEVKESYALEYLNKCKLDELHVIANKINININLENGKKKKKADLAKEIFENQ